MCNRGGLRRTFLLLLAGFNAPAARSLRSNSTYGRCALRASFSATFYSGWREGGEAVDTLGIDPAAYV